MKSTSARSLVSALLALGCPSAIARLVVTVVVNAVYRVLSRWPRPHVGQEVLKLLPALTDSNAAPAVVRVLVAFGVVAALTHSVPGVVFVGIVAAMLGFVLNSNFALETSATARVANAQVPSIYDSSLAAVALAKPVFAPGVFKNNQTPNAESGNVFYVEVKWGRLLLSHCASVLCMVVRAASGVTSTGRCSRFNPHYTPAESVL